MYRIILIIVIAFVFENSFSQTNENLFVDFCSSFNENRKTKIPGVLCRDILGYDIMGTSEYTEVYPEKMFSCDSTIVILIKMYFLSEMESSNYILLQFKKDGTLMKNDILGWTLLDFDNVVLTNYCVINDTILEVVEKDDFSKGYYYYKISCSGYHTCKIDRTHLFRRSIKASTRILRKNEIQKLTKLDLDIMRNEIFADYGYIFKTQKWKDYFSDKPWYTPRYDDVSDMLNMVEKINIQTILEVSSNKSD